MARQPVLLAGNWNQSAGSDSFRAEDPARCQPLADEYPISDWTDCEIALNAAAAAIQQLRSMPGEQLAKFLEGYAALIDDQAIFGEDDIVADFFGKTHFVRDENAGHAIIDEIADDGEHFAHGFGVECGCDLIEQHQFRPHGKRAGNRHTLLLAGSFNAINATLYDKLSFNFIRDIAPVAGIMRNPLIMEVNPSVPAATVAEFIAYAKANPGKLNMGSAGNGSPQHMAGELFKVMAGVNIVHVSYRGAAAMLTDLMRGELHVAFDPMLSSLWYDPQAEGGARRGPIGRALERFNAGFHGLGQRYRRVIAWALDHRLATLALATAAFVAAMSLFGLGLVGGQFMPTSDEEQTAITVETPVGSSLEYTASRALEIA